MKEQRPFPPVPLEQLNLSHRFPPVTQAAHKYPCPVTQACEHYPYAARCRFTNKLQIRHYRQSLWVMRMRQVPYSAMLWSVCNTQLIWQRSGLYCRSDLRHFCGRFDTYCVCCDSGSPLKFIVIAMNTSWQQLQTFQSYLWRLKRCLCQRACTNDSKYRMCVHTRICVFAHT